MKNLDELKFLFPMNLQLFGVEDDVDPEPEDDVDPDDDGVEPEADDDTDPEPEPEPAKKERNVPEATFLAEKKRRKELERKLRELEESKMDSEILARKSAKVKELVEKGFDETVAHEMANMLSEALAEVRSVSRRKSEDELFMEDLEDLASEPYYSDIKGYAKDIKAKMDKVKGLTIEEAYLLVRGPARSREVKTEVEQKAALDRRKAADKKVADSTPPAKAKDMKLDADDLKALARLQEMQPDAGWTKKKYFETMKG